MQTKLILSALFVISAIIIPSPAKQNYPASTMHALSSNRTPAPPTDPQEYEGQRRITEPMTLPNFEQYTERSRFLGGIATPNAHAGPTYLLRWSSMDQPGRIIDWYKSNFQSNEWSVGRVDANYIAAKSKHGDYCSITVSTTRNAKAPSGIVILFKAHKV